MRRRLSGRNAPNVRILWVRSASLIKTTRISRVIAKIILRKFSTCASWRVRNFNLSSFDTPSTISATLAPNSSFNWDSV